MSEQEAINTLSQMFLPCFSNKEFEALNMAIRALESQKKSKNTIN